MERRKPIVLIGMPGSGKTTIGRLLANRAGYEFVDTDVFIEEKEKRKIKDIFATDGEDEFRRLETLSFKMVIEANRVIATGGGIVKRDENYYIAKEGIVVFIDRPLDDIMADIKIDDRPLLADGRERLLKLYNERYDKYLKWADIHIKGTNTIEEVIDKIIDEVKNYENNGN